MVQEWVEQPVQQWVVEEQPVQQWTEEEQPVADEREDVEEGEVYGQEYSQPQEFDPSKLFNHCVKMELFETSPKQQGAIKLDGTIIISY